MRRIASQNFSAFLAEGSRILHTFLPFFFYNRHTSDGQGQAMRRTMNAKTLNEYLTPAHTTIMLCRAHADHFALSHEELSDAEWQIEMLIVELDELKNRMKAGAIVPLKACNDVQFVGAV